MKRLLTAICCISMVAVPLLAQTHHSGKAMSGAAMTDQQFVDFAGQTDMVEANLGQLAQNASNSQPVKDYGQMLATDHTNDYQQLTNAAQQASLTVPTAINAENNKTLIGPFQKLKGSAFDRRYIQTMIAGHTKALAVYQKEATDAQNPVIKSYAQAVVPVLQKHLADAKDLEKGGKTAQ